jgi:hypothetical protein
LKPAKAQAVTFVEARAAEQGASYVNWALHDVLVATGRTRELPQNRHVEYQFAGYHDGGETVEIWVAAHYPLRVDPARVASIREQHDRLARVINGRASGLKASRVASEEVEVVDPETGEVTVEVRAKAKAPSKPRAAADPATGCQAGTSGHKVGLIVLRQKPRGFDRSKAIAAAIKELKMDKGLASSWVSTLLKRKPAFKEYGK